MRGTTGEDPGPTAVGVLPNREKGYVQIAVVGTGVAGLATAWLLHRRHAVTVFEAAPRLGGHVNTVQVALGGREVAVDAGFIVFNEVTYPLLTRLLAHLEVPTQPSRMSFSASIGDAAVEYAGGSLTSLFAQRRNAVRPSFLRMLLDIRRFNELGRRHLQEDAADGPSVGQFLDRHGFGRGLSDWYLLPMAAAIWSAPVAQMRDYPARSLLTFFANHGLLGIGRRRRHTWRTVVGGSARYVDRLATPFRQHVRLATPIKAVRRTGAGVELRDGQGRQHRFDHAVLACHADQNLAMLEDASPAEREVLGAFRFQANRAILHRDPALMPRRREAWASWNYLAPAQLSAPQARVSATYWINRLQRLLEPEDFFVSLNPLREPAAHLVHAEFAYAHPVFDAGAIAAQRRLGTIQGRGGLWHAGAWCGYGFHEDGLRSAFAVAEALGATPPWIVPAEPPPIAATGFLAGAVARPA